jgi:hypothetical protein
MANINVTTSPNPVVIRVQVPGPPGPPNMLTIGTVTAGVQADATITGISPFQELNLVLPRGDTGAQGEPGDLMDAVSSSSVGASALVTSDWLPSTRRWTLSENLTVSIDDDFPAGKSGTITLILKQSGGGTPYTVTWPAGIKWAEDAPAPEMPTAANSKMIVNLFWDGVEWLALMMSRSGM